MALALCLTSPAVRTVERNLHFRHGYTSARPPQQSVSFESLKNDIIRQANAGRVREAMSSLDSISRLNLTPDLTFYCVLLKSCIRTRNYDLGRAVHSKILESGIELDVIVLNSLISLYSKCGDWRKAEEVFASMGELKDLVSWSAMISCYAHNGLNSEAILAFIEMLGFGERPNEYCFSAVIQACSNREHSAIGLIIFGFLIKTGYLESDVCVGCALIDLFVKGFGDVGSARKVFDEMPEKNSVTWTLLMTRLAQMDCPGEAIELFLDMIVAGYVPDRFTLSSSLSACAELGSLHVGQQVHGCVVKSGLCSDVCVGCSLVDMYAKSDGSMDKARKVFDRMPEHNVMSWTAVITGYVQNMGHDEEAIELYTGMITEGSIRPNHFTFAALLKACGNLFNPGLGEQIYGHAVKSGLAAVNCVGNSLISMYARSDRMEDARKAFDFLFEKNLVSYNALVDGYARTLDSDEAFDVFNQSENSSIGVDSFTFASLLSGAASTGAVGKGEQLHARLLKAGLETNLCICNALISMYTRCGDIEAGFQVFNEMEERNVISWTAIIAGFAKHGFAKRALELFHQMLDFDVQPNEVTYIAVLSACSHAGLIAEGWRHFESMSNDHGIKPRMEHYACMVDMLGRSGHLNEAMGFIESMPFPADVLVWRTLLGASSVHGNTELGQRAAKMILKQDPNDPSAHVLLSNLYASSGQWADAAQIRKAMKERNLVKEAGCSWIEVSNRVHKFHVGDTKHPEAGEIYAELDQLGARMKAMGYVPDTNFVLHEVEDEQKEQYLFQHSEKIALAYGLIRTAKAKPIRIFKNLRMCGDCHAAMKYASVLTQREIVVRDSNRFHHIKNGVCSCNDYW